MSMLPQFVWSESQLGDLCESLTPPAEVVLASLHGSARALALAACQVGTGRTFLVLCRSDEVAAALHQDLVFFLGDGVALLPEREGDLEARAGRVEALHRLQTAPGRRPGRLGRGGAAAHDRPGAPGRCGGLALPAADRAARGAAAGARGGWISRRRAGDGAGGVRDARRDPGLLPPGAATIPSGSSSSGTRSTRCATSIRRPSAPWVPPPRRRCCPSRSSS